MTYSSALARGRRRMREVQLRSRVTVYRRNPNRDAQDEATGREVPAWDAVADGVPAKLQAKGSRRVAVGGVVEQRATPEMDLDATCRDLADGDVLVLTAGEWVGDAYRVTEAIRGDGSNVRTVPVEHLDRRPPGLPEQ